MTKRINRGGRPPASQTKKRINVYITDDTLDKVRKYQLATGATSTFIVESAVQEWLDKRAKE